MRKNKEVSGRFSFGKNWKSFLSTLDEERIKEAEKSLEFVLKSSLNGSSFLDIGSGSGLFSLAAIRLGAVSVHSIDYDINSVQCAQLLKERYFPNADNWTISQGDILSDALMSQIQQHDIIYSWGVLHHTGQMWQAVENAIKLVKPKGRIYISIYNDQGSMSKVWLLIKLIYNKNIFLNLIISWIFITFWITRGFFIDAFRLKNPFKRYSEYKKHRGMSMYHDWKDWLGGNPFEVAKPETIFEFFFKRNFSLKYLKTQGGGRGCNEFMFKADE